MESGAVAAPAAGASASLGCEHCRARWERDTFPDQVDPSASCKFTQCELERWASTDALFLWISAHASVYRVPREWAEKVHPGGSKSILRKAGKDCTLDFDFHSQRAQTRVWQGFRAGELVPCVKAHSLCLIV